MKKSRFSKIIVQTFESIRDLTATKGEEYANDDTDQFANFKRQAAELGLTQEQILSVYLSKHLDAVKSYVRTGQEFSEPISGRIDDAILYLILLRAMVIERHEAAKSPT